MESPKAPAMMVVRSMITAERERSLGQRRASSFEIRPVNSYAYLCSPAPTHGSAEQSAFLEITKDGRNRVLLHAEFQNLSY